MDETFEMLSTQEDEFDEEIEEEKVKEHLASECVTAR